MADTKTHHSKIEIKEKWDNGMLGVQILVDGKELHGVRGYSLTHECTTVPILHLDLFAYECEIESDTATIDYNH